MTAVLAVDGGQSTLRVSVSVSVRDTPTGTEIASARGLRRRDAPADVAVAVTALWRQLGSPAIDTVALGLSTLPAQPADREALAARLISDTHAPRVVMADDGITAHLGALPALEGITLTAGTGVACTGWMPGRPVVTIDGAGYLLGDDGAGYWIGREGLRAALRAHDGRGPVTSLATLAEEQFGALESLPDRLHEDPRPADTIAAFARIVAEQHDDRVAADIVAGAADALRESVDAAARCTGATTVALGGGVLASGSPVHGALRARLAEFFTVQDAAGTPLDGARRLAAELPDDFRPHVHTYPGSSVHP